MTIDLGRLREQHPRLSETTAAMHIQRAALGLQRRHRPGVPLTMRLEREEQIDDLVWPEHPDDEAELLDRRRITEDGAETIALAVAYARRGWTVLRRLQRGEFGDWLLAAPGGDRVAFEVAGIDDGDDRSLMTKELEQVQKSPFPTRAACVVRFREPRCTLTLVGEPQR